ncbi:MAG: ABC transporter ATP-binding protein [Armatimonadetes bacterium]|nr:ABC transporter ATP-binding protein [Armatimonadota bacterium]
MVSLDRVAKVYFVAGREVRALDEVTMQVARGEFVVARGPSGSGKTTLLLTIGGMIRPTAGTVSIDGEDVYAMSPAARARLRAKKIGFVFQMYHLVPYLTALENVMLPALAGNRVTEDEAVELLARLGMKDRLHHRVSQLSTGERQRVALARALVKKPQLLLADEPTGNLDPENGERILQYMAEFNRDGGTVLVVTHDPVAERFASRTLMLQAGRLQPPTS